MRVGRMAAAFAWIFGVLNAELSDLEVYSSEYSYTKQDSMTTQFQDIQFSTHEITGNMLDPKDKDAKREVIHPPPIGRRVEEQNQPAFVPVSVDVMDNIEIPDAILLNSEQIRQASIIVLVGLLAGSVLLGIVYGIYSYMQTRRTVHKLISKISRLRNPSSIELIFQRSSHFDVHQACTTRLRVLKLASKVEGLLVDAEGNKFDDANWIVCKESSHDSSKSIDIGSLLSQLQNALQECNDLLALDNEAKSLKAKLVDTIATVSELKLVVHSKLTSALSTNGVQNGWSLREYEKILNLWHALGFTEKDMEKDGTNWYKTTLAELKERDARLAKLRELKALEPLTDPTVSEMKTILVEAQMRDWNHDLFHEVERLVEDYVHESDRQVALVTFDQQVKEYTTFQHNFIYRKEETITNYIQQYDLTRGDAVMHIERLYLDYNIHLQRLASEKQNTEMKLREKRKLHMETLKEKQQRERERAKAKWLRDRKKHDEKIQLAAKEFENRQNLEIQKQKEIQLQAEREAFQRMLEKRHELEWHLVKWILFLDLILILLVVAIVFWEALVTSNILSSTCDVRTSYWTPNKLSVWSCQLFYGAKVAATLVAIVICLSCFSYMNLPLVGVTLVLGIGLYIFRASWKNMLVRFPYFGWIFAFNYIVGYALSCDSSKQWKLGVNWRPFLVYVIYPCLSFVLSVFLALRVACDSPSECFESAISWTSNLVNE